MNVANVGILEKIIINKYNYSKQTKLCTYLLYMLWLSLDPIQVPLHGDMPQASTLLLMNTGAVKQQNWVCH